MAIAHNLGLPRIGTKREMKFAVENYWQSKISQDELRAIGKNIRMANWQLQLNAGHDFLSVGDFSWYDHVLDLSVLLGVVPSRFTRAKITQMKVALVKVSLILILIRIFVWHVDVHQLALIFPLLR